MSNFYSRVRDAAQLETFLGTRMFPFAAFREEDGDINKFALLFQTNRLHMPDSTKIIDFVPTKKTISLP